MEAFVRKHEKLLRPVQADTANIARGITSKAAFETSREMDFRALARRHPEGTILRYWTQEVGNMVLCRHETVASELAVILTRILTPRDIQWSLPQKGVVLIKASPEQWSEVDPLIREVAGPKVGLGRTWSAARNAQRSTRYLLRSPRGSLCGPSAA